MKKLINIIAKAIDCPLMDTHNIPFEISYYLTHKIFYLEYVGEMSEFERLITNACFLATNEEHAWELYEQQSKDIHVKYRLNKDVFMMNLSGGYGSYLTTNGACVRHLKVDWFDDLDNFHMLEYEYKKPTKNVLRKKIIEESGGIYGSVSSWYLPMIDVMMDGVEYKPVSILRRGE